ncbi:hypothetical protein AMQ83_17675 [Paenibacillus riograndensis]|nr:hypothetical protein AMQ83_17675 [Paenibacillus riograndensis]
MQKLRTLIASNEMPAMFDTDPDAYASKLVQQGKLVNMKKLLEVFSHLPSMGGLYYLSCEKLTFLRLLLYKKLPGNVETFSNCCY